MQSNGSSSRRATYPSACDSTNSRENFSTASTSSSTAFEIPNELVECRQALRDLWVKTSPMPLPIPSRQPPPPRPQLKKQQSSKQQPQRQSFIDLPERQIRLALSELRCHLARDLAPFLEERLLASRIWRREFGSDCDIDKEDTTPASSKIPVTPEHPPEPGDVVQLNYYRLPHLVVVESIEANAATGLPRLFRAIHYGRPSLFSGIRVLRDEFRLDNASSCDGMTVRQFPSSACRPAGETIERARSCLGQAGHSMLGNNAGTFARWCKLYAAGSAAQRFATLAAYEEQSELRVGDHIDWPAADTNSAPGFVHAEVRAVGRRHNLQALRLLISSAEVNSAQLEFTHRRTLDAYPGDRLALRHRLTVGPVPALPPDRLARRAAAFLGAIFPAGAVSSLSFATVLASDRDPLESLAMSDRPANSCYSVDSVQLNDLCVGDVVSIDGQPPGLLIELDKVEAADGSSRGGLVRATLLVYSHSPLDTSVEPVREFRCYIDARRAGLHQRIRVSLQHADFACPLAEACAQHTEGYTAHRVLEHSELQPGCVVSYRRHVSDIGVDDFDENDFDDDDDCHRLAFRHAVVSSCCGSADGNIRIAEVGLIYFSPALGWVRQIRRVFDLARDEVHLLEYASGQPRSLEDSLSRAQRRLCGSQGGAALEDAEARRLGARYDLRANNGRQFARWCRQRDDFELDADPSELDAGGIEWLQAWQSRLSARQLPETSQQLRHCLHRCLQAIGEFSDSSPLSAAAPLLSVCLRICSAADSASGTSAANQHQLLVRRALCPGFFAVLASSVAETQTGTDGCSEVYNDSDARNNPEVEDDAELGDVRAFLVCFAASVAGAALDFDIGGGRGGGGGGGASGVGFSKQLADLRRFFHP